ncbi:MAG TPA: DNA-binding response regulator [Treponema sp.]|nr:DNA-binding response regulator [Treponema sp.]
MKILIVDDEAPIRELVRYNLEKEGYGTVSAENGTEALRLARSENPSLVILDLMLPDMGGLDVCRVLKNDTKTMAVPIIIVTAKTEDADIVAGLELGADDYVAKPFSPREVAARIRNILRRSEPVNAESVENSTLGNIVLEEKSFIARIGGTVMELTAREFDMLMYFSRNKNLVLSREQILNKVWGTNAEVDARAVDTCIKRLRKKIEQYKTGITVTALYGAGYKVEEDGSE